LLWACFLRLPFININPDYPLYVIKNLLELASL
jgi:hypothetical protein